MNTIQDQLESLYGKAKQYTESSIELYKLQAIGKTADIVSALVSRLALFTIISLFTLFVNIAIIYNQSVFLFIIINSVCSGNGLH